MEKLTEIKSRLLQFAEYQGLKKEEFYRQIGIDGANFRGKNALSELGSEKIVSILSTFLNLNPDWLLLGKGEMLRSDAQKTVSSSADSVPWSRYDAAQQEIGALRTRLEQSAESVARLLKENSELRKNPVSPSPATPKEPTFA